MGHRGMWRSSCWGSEAVRLQVGQAVRERERGPRADRPTARLREEQNTSGWAGWARLVSGDKKETLPGPDCESSRILSGTGAGAYISKKSRHASI